LSWKSTLGAVYQILATGISQLDVGPFLLRVDGSDTVVQSQSTYSSMFLNLPFRVSPPEFALRSRSSNLHSSLHGPTATHEAAHKATV
jgi:hypothetical protein